LLGDNLLYILGFKSSQYEKTTPIKLSEDFNLKFVNGLKDIELTNKDVLIRYGVTYFPKKDYDCRIVINSARAVSDTIDKVLSTKLLLRSNIPMPKVFFDSNKIRYKDLPVFRRLKNHSKGKDIIIVRKLKDMPKGDFFTKYIPSKREYRILVFRGQALRIQLKHKKKESVRDKVKNSEHGYRFLNVFEHNVPMEKRLIQIAIRSVQVLNLDFGAVDILVGRNGRPYVLEVNSAPRLNRSGRELLMLHILETVGAKFDMLSFHRIKMNNRLLDLPLRFITYNSSKKRKD